MQEEVQQTAVKQTDTKAVSRSCARCSRHRGSRQLHVLAVHAAREADEAVDGEIGKLCDKFDLDVGGELGRLRKPAADFVLA